MAGKLYLCATPIGNLEDITFRVVRVLGEVDLIAAEDTRNSIKLLNHFEIKTPMTSYHEHNKIEKGKRLIEKLESGMSIALITDAGTPGISDPGEELVKMCYEAGIEVTSLPGAAACFDIKFFSQSLEGGSDSLRSVGVEGIDVWSAGYALESPAFHGSGQLHSICHVCRTVVKSRKYVAVKVNLHYPMNFTSS